MTDNTYDVEYLEVGDTFEGGPIEQSYFIGAVMGAGGEVYIDGNKVVILALPNKAPKAKAVEAPKPVEKAPEPVLSPAEDLAPAEEVVKEEAPKAVAKPIFKPKAAPAPESDKE